MGVWHPLTKIRSSRWWRHCDQLLSTWVATQVRSRANRRRRAGDFSSNDESFRGVIGTRHRNTDLPDFSAAFLCHTWLIDRAGLMLGIRLDSNTCSKPAAPMPG